MQASRSPAGEVRGTDRAPVDGVRRHMADETDVVGAAHGCRREDAVCQHVDMKVPHTQAAGHDLHRLLDAKDLAAVFQQGLPGVHHQVSRPFQQVILHGYSPVQR